MQTVDRGSRLAIHVSDKTAGERNKTVHDESCEGGHLGHWFRTVLLKATEVTINMWRVKMPYAERWEQFLIHQIPTCRKSAKDGGNDRLRLVKAGDGNFIRLHMVLNRDQGSLTGFQKTKSVMHLALMRCRKKIAFE